MRRRNTTKKTALTLTGLLGCAAVAAGIVPAVAFTAAPSHTPAAAAAPLSLTGVRTQLAGLEADADHAGVAAERADEALLQHDTATNRAAARTAHAALVTLAKDQSPELTRLAARATALGAEPDAVTGDGTTATTTALVGRTRALRAVSYARAQIGDPYGFAKAGPGRWDCSGLTMKSYSAVHVNVGGHSATAQYRRARAEHRLHSYSNRKPGDLIFYGSPGSVYHVAIYSGHGKMVEAPYPGKRVRQVAVRSWGRLSVVARPA